MWDHSVEYIQSIRIFINIGLNSCQILIKIESKVIREWLSKKFFFTKNVVKHKIYFKSEKEKSPRFLVEKEKNHCVL